MQGCTDGARTYRMPFISGKDSLFNEFDGEAIPGTLLISALGLVPDLRRAVDSAGMQIGDDLWLVSERRRARRLACVGSFRSGATRVPTRSMIHCRVTGRSTRRSATARSPQPMTAVRAALRLPSARWRSQQLGVSVVVPLDGLDPFTALVNEAPGRLVLSVAPEHRDAVGAFLGDHGRHIGEITAGDDIVFHLLDPARGEDSNLAHRIPLADAVSASTLTPGPTKGDRMVFRS